MLNLGYLASHLGWPTLLDAPSLVDAIQFMMCSPGSHVAVRL